MGRLVPCTACKRHFFLADTVCPHCGASSIDPSTGTDRRLGLLTGALAMAMSAAACGDPPTPVYGPAPIDSNQRSAKPTATPSESAPPALTSSGPTASAAPSPSAAPSVAGNPSAAPSAAANPTTPQPTATHLGPPPPTAVALYAPTPISPDKRSPPGL